MALQSIAFIPDGNRRYAKVHQISLLQSYQLGTQKAWDVIDWLKPYKNIKSGTFYTLSLENLTRKKNEIGLLLKVFEREIDKALNSPVFEKDDLKLQFVGRLNAFPKKIQDKMKKLQERTENFKSKTINLALGYSGQAEIADAAKKIAEDYQNNKIDLTKLDEKKFREYLYNPLMADPDLIIRTSGTQRLSGFLTYQSAYSELLFCNKYWPEFEKSDLDFAVRDFDNRQRNFGK
ncbi:MAG: polyprenyl diphosphate synthase [Candidatus Micrarchaeota archaeon]